MKLKKIRNSSQSYGRGSDAAYTPAKYGMFDGEVMVCTVSGRSRGYMEPSSWDVDWESGSRGGFNTKATATEWAMKLFSRKDTDR